MAAQEILGKLVAINSVFPNEGKLALFLEKELARIGFKTQRHYVSNKRFNLLAQRGAGKKSILFYGHMDTVPVYGSWKSNPFVLTGAGDRLVGIGSSDMKGGIASLIAALEDHGKDNNVKLLFCVDEENISLGAWKVFDEKLKWFEDVAFAISLEPGSSERHVGGINVVTLGRRGRVVINVDIVGLSAHGAVKERGISAIDEAVKIISQLERMKFEAHSELGKESMFIRKIESASTSLSVPDKLHMELDIHIVPPNNAKKIIRQMEKLIKKMRSCGKLNKKTSVSIGIKERQTPYIEPYVTSKESSIVKQILAIVRENFGNPIINYSSSVADDNIIANSLDIPVITIGPSGGNEHASNEWVSARSLNELSKLYSMILEISN